jgi:hypothetical protein
MECRVYEYNGNPQGASIIVSGRYEGTGWRNIGSNPIAQLKGDKGGTPDSLFC